MKKVFSLAIAYGMWIVDLALAFWLFYISRDAYLGIFALFYKKGQWGYSHLVDFLDKTFMLLLGLSWLTFMIVVEEYLRAGIHKGNLLKRFARVTGPVLLGLFVVDLILFWLGGIGSGNWFRWLILAGELGIGLVMLVYTKTKTPLKSN
jgi:hypothetical protein